jgi:hypothetical protein
MRRTYRAEVALTRGVGVCQGTADDQVKASTGAGARIIGVTEEAQSVVGGPISVVLLGECIAISGQAAITAGMELLVDANGKFTTAEGDAANERAGRAISGAAADTDEFVMFVNPVKLWT